MLSQLAVLALAAVVTPLAAAVGVVRVLNKCPTTVYVWSVGAGISGPFGLGQGASYSEQMVKDPVTGGKALKVAKTADGLYTGAPETIFAYNLDKGNVWYDLSDVFGDGFAGSKLVVASAEASCPSIVWADGVPPAGSQVKVCTASKDVTFTLCA